jgi:hypothetical protein
MQTRRGRRSGLLVPKAQGVPWTKRAVSRDVGDGEGRGDAGAASGEMKGRVVLDDS